MENVNFAGFLGGLGRVSLQAAVMVLVVLAAQGLLRKQLTPRWRCALWLLVVARLLLPVSFGTAVSIFNLLPHWTSRVEVVRPPAKPAADRPLVIGSPARTTPLIATSIEEEIPSREPANLPEGPPTIAAPSTAAPGPAISIRHQLDRRFSWADLLFCNWLLGVLVLSGYVVVSSARLARTFSRLTPLTDPTILKVLADCRSLMNIKTGLAVVESSAVSCPALFGLLRPRLVLPSGFGSSFSEREMRFIFLHELAHLKRRDLALNWLVAALQVLHWFNPIVWLGFARWRADRELACDAMALDAAGAEQNTEYGRTILRLLAGFTRGRPEAGLVGILESKHQLLRRIGMIANYVPGRRWQFLALLLAGAIGVIGLTDAQTSQPKKDRSNSLVQTNQPAAQPSRLVVTNGATMKVLVLDAESGKPLAGAEVLAPNHASFFGGKENAPRWLTDQEGVALIHLGEVPSNHLAELSWFTLSARHAGYGPRGVSWSAENKDVRPSLPAEITIRLAKGSTVGGTVRDEKGTAFAGIAVKVYGSGYWQGLRHEYPEFWTDSTDASVILTDRQGRWQASDFPKDLEVANIEIWRPNGAAQPFYA
ncbi:MAG TPA: M56 family metallopeptidase, partial [Methylomirabilota bacterium]|nr:M56 family metallopeptidase [Methylomirabilota bacterium]